LTRASESASGIASRSGCPIVWVQKEPSRGPPSHSQPWWDRKNWLSLPTRLTSAIGHWVTWAAVRQRIQGLALAGAEAPGLIQQELSPTVLTARIHGL
jgi:hypothetical protein